MSLFKVAGVDVYLKPLSRPYIRHLPFVSELFRAFCT